ncbi:Ricin B lectin [Catenulispora acidiphila DSM 44928]|uniref:Ricin B lectin n=1 Tax=Catenulispora acidiphila (strain DSM 44928 / JCM 14897 / NBRC 102108 / NRRL B-24433 / ID139908) TaxID=479433 RepID=C7QAI8_CATAD|nr:glycoside hydrolase family 76 protein [Catenulispora acidiphila]ACU72487.1 Ricin B lectin [Catenulispora acidiphila DSM 44928]
MFGTRTRSLVTAIVALVSGLAFGIGLLGGGAAAAAPRTAVPAVSSPAAASGAKVLMAGYNSGNGLIGGDGWWTSAVALSTIMTYQQTTGDTSYSYAIAGAFNANKGSNFENDYMDDTGWWGLAWVQAYDITGNTAYLQMAQTDANYIHGYWDSVCGGGVYWSTAKSYKNAIPNELFLDLTAALHNRIAGDSTYLGWANAEWNWFNGSGMINGSHLINDGLTSGCQNNGQTVWTYNQGVILAGLSELSRATGNTGLLTTAETLANASTAHFNQNGIVVEPCEPNCGADGPSFKGVYVRGLRSLATAAGTTAYNSYLQAQANSIIAHDTNSAGQLGLSWAGPIQSITSGSQASAEAALVAALVGTAPPIGPITSGIAGKCVDDNHQATANGTAIQLWTCNGSSAQQFTVNANGSLSVLGKCMDIISGGTANGVKVQLYDCNGTGAQVWNAQSNGTLLNPQSGRCLDDPASSTTDGTQLQIWDCNGGANQKWTLP